MPIPYPSSGLLSPHDVNPDRARQLAGDWSSFVFCLKSYLETMIVTGPHGKVIDQDKGFRLWTNLGSLVRRQRNTVYLVGNGASASMASHMAADLAKNARVHTEVFSDLALITAIANDISYDEVFAEPLRRRMNKEDMLVAVSSSGGSPNVLKAVQTARELDGFVITLSAMNSKNPLRQTGDLNFYISANSYGEAESCHAAILHHWMDHMALDLTYTGK